MEPPCSIEQGGFFVLCFDEYKNAITLPKVEAWAMTPKKVKFDVFWSFYNSLITVKMPNLCL
ncbi:hypothetical protein DOS84_10025 [Flavobacterium aquariorum]|uniref:Uncharacterized protein n=1 Tax=Flavobacterium aquariorum TaxID=2217670 RepID=A0A2W7UEW9_9FLAO|nr:hypothetical protein DOS84_10025 [Flavobacterium aquariorum]